MEITPPLPIYNALRTSFDASIEAQNRLLGRDVRTVSERFEVLLRDAEALIEQIGEAELRGDMERVGALNERYRSTGLALAEEASYLQEQGVP